jgi:putative transposase
MRSKAKPIPLSSLLQLGAQWLIQQALEQETTEKLGRAHYQHRQLDEPLLGYRNGYETGRLHTAQGEITVQVPQVWQWAGDGPYRSQLMAFLRGHSDVLERLAVEMTVRGLSVRDIEDAFTEATGERILSRSAVSVLTDTLWQDYEAFCQRDLSPFENEGRLANTNRCMNPDPQRSTVGHGSGCSRKSGFGMC